MSKFIPVSEPDLSGNEKKYVNDCLDSTWISSLGEYIGKFEKGFAEFSDSKHGISVANGTVALHLALATLGIKPGDEVIIPNLTFVATANVVKYVGATPIMVDVSPHTWTIDPEKIKEKITKKTKAIIPVHLYGHPADMDPIMEIAKEHNLFVIEDAAEAHGARYKGKKVGSIGDVGCFSFYGNKIITTGEGGMLTTNDKKLAEHLQFLKDHGMSPDKRYFHPEIGYNFRMTNIQAALGLAQLERVNDLLQIRQNHANLYEEFLKDIGGIRAQPTAEWADVVYWLHSYLVTDKFSMSRDKLIAHLKKQNIDSRPFFIPLTDLPPYKQSELYPVSSSLSSEGISLPSSTLLRDEDIERICAVFKT